MPVEIQLPLSGVLAFSLVLARVGGAISLIPLPGIKNIPVVARIVLSLGLAVSLFPVWPMVDPAGVDVGRFAMWMIAEASFGATVGLAVSFLNEAFVLGSQIFGLQAGYGYASTVDPATEADSSVLQIVSHLVGSLLFLALGLHREVIRVFAASLSKYPPGQFQITGVTAEAVLGLGADMFGVAVRLSLPVVAVLMLIDLSLALLGRINAQLQLLTLAFPAKMVVSMGLLITITVLMPRLYETAAAPTFQVLTRIVTPAPQGP